MIGSGMESLLWLLVDNTLFYEEPIQTQNRLIFQDRDRVFTNSLTKDATEQIFRALVLLDWRHGIIFSSLLIRHRPAVLQAVQSKQLTLAFDHDNSLLYYMSRAEAAELEVV